VLARAYEWLPIDCECGESSILSTLAWRQKARMQSERHILLFSYHFPPSNAAGAHRWKLLCDEGAKRGWHFDVICCETPGIFASVAGIERYSVPYRAHWLERARQTLLTLLQVARARFRTAMPTSSNGNIGAADSVGSEAVVLKHQLPSALSRIGLKRSFNTLFYYIPGLRWKQAAQRVGLQLSRFRAYDAVICSSPPHLTSLAAAVVAKRRKLPLILDFRDPWSAMDVLQPDYASPFFYRLADFLEERAVRHASLLVMNTEEAREATQPRHPGTEIVVVRNGSAPTSPACEVSRRDRFEMLFAGAIYLDRDPRPLLQAIRDFAQAEGVTSKEFQMRFVGNVSHFGDVSLTQYTEALGISDLVSIEAPVARKELGAMQQRAAVLVNLPQSARLCIPSKLYEYFEHPSWILALEERGTASHRLLVEANAVVCAPGDVAAIATAIASLYRRFQKGETPKRVVDTLDVSIVTQADILFAKLEAIVRARNPMNAANHAD